MISMQPFSKVTNTYSEMMFTSKHVKRRCTRMNSCTAAVWLCTYIKLESFDDIWSGMAIFAWIRKLRGVPIERGLNSDPEFSNQRKGVAHALACSAYLLCTTTLFDTRFIFEWLNNSIFFKKIDSILPKM